MRTRAKLQGSSRSLEGELVVSFAVPDEVLADLDKLKGELVLEVKKFNAKRSINANNYFWQLCTDIANALGTTKEAVYMLQLSRYGYFIDIEIETAYIGQIRSQFRYVEEYEQRFFEGETEKAHLRCYIGSSQYDKEQMQILISGTVEDAKQIGVSTWDEEELQMLIREWECKS